MRNGNVCQKAAARIHGDLIKLRLAVALLRKDLRRFRFLSLCKEWFGEVLPIRDSSSVQLEAV